MSIPETYRDRNLFKKHIEGNNCIIYISDMGGQKLVLKIHRPESRHLREVTGGVTEKVVKLQTLFNILKKYYGHYLVDTKYYVYDQTIAEVKPFIPGIAVDQFDHRSEIVLAAHDLKFHLQELWQEFRHDPGLGTIDQKTLTNLWSPDLVFSNFIYSPPDNYHIIDW